MGKKKIIVVMPAYNAERTLRRTYTDIPKGLVDEIILVDDKSRDKTVEIAKELGLKVVVHEQNLGYGANQKTCYKEALSEGADIVVMLHPDYQYDPVLLPDVIRPIKAGECECVLGSRILGTKPTKCGMPKYKYLGNRVLTTMENLILGQTLSEYHTGYRAYSRRLLTLVPFQSNSNNFVFDTEIIVQIVAKGLSIKEIPVEARYFKEASSIDLLHSVQYGVGIVLRLAYYVIWRATGIQLFRIK
jgi:glycosyltransferase involved in cell wall biosynthesis